MVLDNHGIVIACPACGATNRLVYRALDRPMRCARCHAALNPPSSPIEVTERSAFDALVSSAPLPIVVDFWAQWCGPCRMMAPQIERVAKNTTGTVIVVKVNTDLHPELGERFRIRSIPTIAIFRNGREVGRASGVRSAADIEALVANGGLRRRLEETVGLHWPGATLRMLIQPRAHRAALRDSSIERRENPHRP